MTETVILDLISIDNSTKILSFLYVLIFSSLYFTFVPAISIINLTKYEETAFLNAKNLRLSLQSLDLDIPQKPLLCVTFLSLRSEKSWNNLLQNVKYAKESCEWLAVSYNSVDEKLLSSRVAVMDDVARSVNTAALIQRHSFGDSDGLMKPLLFDVLLPRLRWYSRVWLMDEDISIVGFKFLSYFGIWNCAFDKASPPPVISQPLINGNKYSPPFDKDGWAMYKNAVVAIQSAWIEQQSPILEARFFAWFIENFIFPMKSDFIKSRSDFGYDQTWCGAAEMWNHMIREAAPRGGNSTDHVHNPPCVVIMADNHVNHHDFKTITDWHAKKDEWLNRSIPLISAYKTKFAHIFYDGFHDRAFYDKQRWFSKQSGTCKHKPFMHTIPDSIVESPQIRQDFLSYTYLFMGISSTNFPSKNPTEIPTEISITTAAPSFDPSLAPIDPFNISTALPIVSLTIAPSMSPSVDPLNGPTALPILSAAVAPPSMPPSIGPSNGPPTLLSMPPTTIQPSATVSRQYQPSSQPTHMPSMLLTPHAASNATNTLHYPTLVPSNSSFRTTSTVNSTDRRCAKI